MQAINQQLEGKYALFSCSMKPLCFSEVYVSDLWLRIDEFVTKNRSSLIQTKTFNY